jgi:hypothetical protein
VISPVVASVSPMFLSSIENPHSGHTWALRNGFRPSGGGACCGLMGEFS